MTSPPASRPRQRLRELVPGLKLGNWPPGPLNDITDVPGVLTHTTTLQDPSNPSINTGVTVVLPHRDWFRHAVHAGFFRFNGAGEMTGTHWVEETGLLRSPVVLTNSFAVGDAYRGVYDHAVRHHAAADGSVGWFLLPVVAETFDGHLNDMAAFAVRPAHVARALEAASPGPTPEGCTGGGTGMCCHGCKGGTGTSSRVVAGAAAARGHYTLGVLVQANYGKLRDLRVAGAPVGEVVMARRARAGDAAVLRRQAELQAEKERRDGSIVVVLATDAPLHPAQLERLARRTTAGLARVGGYGHNQSGDLFLAFSTANKIPVDEEGAAGGGPVDTFRPRVLALEAIEDNTINGLFEAAADATEEAIYNALCMAETTVGHQGRRADAIDLDQLKGILEEYIDLQKRASSS